MTKTRSEEYNNPEITKLDIEICSIRKVPLPRIVNHIHRSSPRSDIWLCENCKSRGDKWYLMIHICKALRHKKLKIEFETQQGEQEIQRRLESSKWTCRYCKEKTDRLYAKLHYRCIPKKIREELEKQNPETVICKYCKKEVNSYYINFHYPYCSGQIAPKEKIIKRATEERSSPRYKRRITRKGEINYNEELSDFLRHKAVLEKLEDGQYYWVLYDTRTGKRIRRVEKATKEELSCWDPNQPDGIDPSREVKG